MLFWRSVEIDTPGFECTKKLLVLKCESDSAFVTTDAIKDKKLFDSLKLSDGARFAAIPGVSVPVITVEPTSNATDVSKVYDTLIKALHTDNEKVMMRKVRDVLAPQVGTDVATKIVSAIKLQYEWETAGVVNSVLRIDAADTDVTLRAATMKMLEDINTRFVQAITSISPADNYTRFQNAETDVLFIEIPNRSEVLETESVFNLIPNQDEVCKPYSDPAAFSPDYKSKGLPKYLITQIEGQKQNNKDEVFENEEMYYKALDEWVRFNMTQEFGSADGGVIDKLSEDYLQQLIASVYIWHWRHNSRVPKGVDTTAEKDETADIDSVYVFDALPGKGAPDFNAAIVLQEFLKEASVALGYKVYLKALIQIARWGSRKPTAIVFDDYEKEFVLGTGIVGQKKGDLSDYSIVKSGDNDCRLAGLIYDNAAIRDTTIGVTNWEFPVGIVTATTIESKSGDHEEYFTYYHFLDLINLLDSTSIEGVINNDGWKITEDVPHYNVSELLNLYEKTEQSLLQFPFYRSQKLVDLLLELQVVNSRVPINVLSIMNSRVADPNLKTSVTKARFSTKEELFDAISQGRVTSKVTATELNIVGALLPIYLQMNKLWQGDITNAIELWREASNGCAGITDWYGAVKPITSFGESTSATETVTHNEPDQTVVNSNSNENTESAAPVADTTAENKVGWMKAVPADATLCKMVVDDEIIGYCYVETGVPVPSNPRKTYSRYTIASMREGRAVSESKLSVYRVFALILHNIFLEDVRGSSLRQVFFEDADTLNVVKKKFQEMGRN